MNLATIKESWWIDEQRGSVHPVPLDQLPEDQVMPTFGVTGHAIRRFRQRVMKLPAKRISQILHTLLLDSRISEGKLVFVWNNRPYELIVQNSWVITVVCGDVEHWTHNSRKREERDARRRIA